MLTSAEQRGVRAVGGCRAGPAPESPRQDLRCSAQSQARPESGTEERNGSKFLSKTSPTIPIPRSPGPTAVRKAGRDISASGGALFPPVHIRAQDPGSPGARS